MIRKEAFLDYIQIVFEQTNSNHVEVIKILRGKFHKISNLFNIGF